MTASLPEPIRARLRAVETLSRAKELIEPRYWLFFGICFVGVALGKLVPFGLLAGPMGCGIVVALREHARGREVRFSDLFRGFEYLVDGLIAALVTVGAFLVLLLGLGASLALATALVHRHVSWRFHEAWDLAASGGFALALLALAPALWLACTLVFALIVDRRVPALQAIGLARRAVVRNPGGFLRLLALDVVLLLLGMLCCGVGALFLVPVTIASMWLAYEAVFPPALEGPPADVGPRN